MAPHPAARVRTLAELHEAIAGCRLCPRVTAAADPVGTRGPARADHRPGARHHRAHARAAVRRRRPGASSSTWLAPLGINEPRGHARALRIRRRSRSAIPGRLPGGRGDRAPDRGERERCRPWTDALVRLCDPAVVVPVGRLAIDDWLGRAPLRRRRRPALRARRPRRSCRSPTPPARAPGRTTRPTARSSAEAVAQLRDTLP